VSWSAFAFAAAPYAEASYALLEDPAFQEFLDDVTAPRCVLLELDVLSLAAADAAAGAYAASAHAVQPFSGAASGAAPGVVTLRFSTHGYRSRLATDSVDASAPWWFEPRILSEPGIDRRIVGRDGIGGLARTGGELQLINADGALDHLSRDYAVEGRAVRLLMGRPTDPYSAFGELFTGVVESVTTGLDAVTLRLSDGAAKLNAPMQVSAYAGTGGNEGGADLAGRPKPVCLGQVRGISPPLVDAANLVYQVHDGAISAVDAVYDRGVALDYTAGVPGAGEYSVDLSTGLFTLGAAPDGAVTADVRGDAGLSGYIDTTGALVLRALSTRAALYSSEIDPGSFSALDSEAPASVGVWIGAEQRTVGSVVDELLAGIGAFGGFSRLGAFTVARVGKPAGADRAVFTENEIIDLAREPLPAPVEPVAWRVAVGWGKNYTPQDDVASGAADAQRSFAAHAWRIAVEEDASIKSRHLLAVEYGPSESLYAEQADAADEALRLFDLWCTRRSLYRVSLPARALTCDLGQVVRIEHARHGFAAGRSVRVLGQQIRGERVELRVLA